MKLFETAERYGDKPAVIMAGSGAQLSYGELVESVYRLSNFFTGLGLKRGDCLAVMMENHYRFFEVYWAAMVSGFYFTPVNSHLAADEAAYIINNCGAKIFVTSTALADIADSLLPDLPDCEVRLMTGGCIDGYLSYEEVLQKSSSAPPETPQRGAVLLYSSGTTGKPKGIHRPLPKPGDKPVSRDALAPFGIGPDSTLLSPAPLYHAAPLGFSTASQAVGATTVVMEKFDAETALMALEKYGVTHSQWVPTMFTRMLKLPEDIRNRYHFPDHNMAMHGAAPCPPDVKRRMIEWWGPILIEYYSGSEAIGMTIIGSEQWLARPGSVGRSIMGKLHICDDEGNELAVGEEGLIYFEQPRQTFSYLNDDKKTRESAHPIYPNWSALGDVGWLDEEGYLYLTDRKSELIISGGVNIYPAEIENLLNSHDAIADVAVLGVPDEEFGEAVKAVVQLEPGYEAGSSLEEALITFCREHLANSKSPRSVDFIDEMPRLHSGKLNKRLLRDKYWVDQESRLV